MINEQSCAARLLRGEVQAMEKLLSKHGTLTLLAILLSLPLLAWLEPNTAVGATVLVTIVILAVNAVGGLIWRPKKPE